MSRRAVRGRRLGHPRAVFLIASTSYDGTVTPNMLYDPTTCQCSMGGGGGGLALRLGPNNSGAIIDSVGWGTATNAFVEGAVTAAPAANNSQSRQLNGCQDTDSNANDFAARPVRSAKFSTTRPRAAAAERPFPAIRQS